MAKLRIATCQFPTTASVRRNAGWVRRQIAQAKRKRADLVHFAECALSGYPSAEKFTFKGYDWDLLKAETESICRAAAQAKVWVVLGSSHPLSGQHKPHNSLYVIDPRGRIVDRYDKRFCTGGDLKHYSPGDHFVTFKVKGVKVGLLICYDVRFPELYREYKKLDVQLMLHSFHNAGGKKRGIWWTIMRPSLQCRAAANAMFVSANNSSRRYQQWPSVLITPDGVITGSLTMHRAGVTVNTVDTRKKYYDATGSCRNLAMRGVLNTGKLVKDSRSRNRKCL